MRITEVLNAVYDRDVGWRPVSGSIKPVHIANGLFRALTGVYYDIRLPVSFIIPWKRKRDAQADPKRTYEALVLETENPRFEQLRSPDLKHRFETLREFARGLLRADDAVFPDATQSSLTLTCCPMISEDSNDRDVGRFMAQILRGGDGNGPLASVLVRCLEEGTRSPGDPISAAAWPLLPTDPQYIERTKQGFPGLSGKKLQEFLELLHQAASDLAAHEAKQGNRLATLQRGVQFSCTALLSHAQVLASDGNLEARPPLLLVLESPKGSRLAIASEESLENFYSQFENWLAKRLAGRLEKHQPLTSSKSSGSGSGESLQLPSARKDAVRKFLGDLETQRGELARRELVDERMGHYEQAIAKHGRDEWVNVVAETLVRCYLSEYTSGGPREFLGGIGRKTGLIFPYFQGRSRDKRVRPSVAILEMLVRACTSAEHAVPLGIFLGRLWKRFGILVGTSTGSGTEDATLLASHGMRVSPNDLEENCNALVLQLEELGLARRYPDNVAYIGRYDV